MTDQLTRPLNFEIQGQIKEGSVRIGDLEWIPGRCQWACHWSISHIHPEDGRIYGKDPLEALTNALDFVSSLIRGSEADGLGVWWQNRGDHGGLTFPLCEGKNWEGMRP
jgi:hypothetical protein